MVVNLFAFLAAYLVREKKTMTTFVAIYRGQTVSDSRLVALSADPSLVADVTARILAERQGEEPDPVVACVEEGKRKALRLIQGETSRDGRNGQS